MLKVFKISILLFFFSFLNTNILLSDDLNERIKKAEKLVSEAEDAFAIESKGHFKGMVRYSSNQEDSQNINRISNKLARPFKNFNVLKFYYIINTKTI